MGSAMKLQSGPSSNFQLVKDELRGRWGSVLGDLYPELIPAMKVPGKTRIPCPIHGSSKGDRGDGFRFFEDFHETGGGICNTCQGARTGIDLICKLENCSEHKALRILEDYLGISPHGPVVIRRKLPAPVVTPAGETEDPEKVVTRDKLLERMWQAALPLADLPDDHIAIRYLVERRGISNLALIRMQDEIRFDPALYYADRDAPAGLKLPGLLSRFVGPDRIITGLHRSYLDPVALDRAQVYAKTKALRRLGSPLRGGVILRGRDPHSRHQNVCEGLETGLSVVMSTGRTVTATTTSSLLANWVPYPGTTHVTIWADRDNPAPINGLRGGWEAAKTLYHRLWEEQITTRIILPPRASEHEEKNDWNDVLRRDGPDPIALAYVGKAPEDWYF